VPSVLVADHEPEVAEMARRYLERASMRALVTCGPAETLRALAARRADLFVIDLTMPGLEVRGVRQALSTGCIGGPGGQGGWGAGALHAGDQSPRRSGAGVPVVFLVDRGDARPHGLNSPPAVRRWLTRPFSPRALVVTVVELLQPVPAPSRPAGLSGVAGLSGGDGPVDRGRYEISLGGRDVSLTRTEFVLVSALAQQPGRVLSRQRLLAALETERGKRPSPRAVDVYVAQLRVKLGTDVIRTVHGVGYVLNPSGTPGTPATPEAPGMPEAAVPAPDPPGQRQGKPYALRRQTPGGRPSRGSGGG
jgi:DNA-binding response OmpR family regulator